MSRAHRSIVRRFAVASAVAALLAPGCGDGPGDTCQVELDWGRGGEFMLPGTDCVECHREGGSDPEHVYAVAGTIYASPDCPIPAADARVRVLDGNGTTATMITNGTGNFFTDQKLVPPFTVAVEVGDVVGTMRYPIDNGSCGRCHAPGSELGLVWTGPGE